MNSIEESGILGIASRLQRLADQLRKDGAAFYAQHGIDFEPKWFPVVYALAKRGAMGVGELANEIGYTHPSTISLLKELEAKKLISSAKDKSDERKRIVSLSAQGEVLVKKMEPIWSIIEEVLGEITQTPDHLLKSIEQVENNLREQNLLQRMLVRSKAIK